MPRESRAESFPVSNVRIDNEHAAKIAAQFGGAVRVEAESFVVRVVDETGAWVCDSHFMRHKEIPWDPIKDGLPVEDCLAATVKHGLAIHSGKMSLYDAVLDVRKSK